MPRGAPSWRGASADAPGSGDPGPPGMIVRAVRRNPDNASSRRVIPLVLRGRKKTGHPAPDPKEGPASRWLCILSRRRGAREDAAPSPFVPTKVGTQSFGRQAWPWAPACAGANGENYFCYCVRWNRAMLSTLPSARPEDLKEDRVPLLLLVGREHR